MLKPYVDINLDKPRKLLFNFNAMVLFEEATGISILNQSVWSNLTAKNIRALVWACLVHEDKMLTLEQVGEMLGLGNLEEITEKLALAWANAMPNKKEEKGTTKDDPLVAN